MAQGFDALSLAMDTQSVDADWCWFVFSGSHTATNCGFVVSEVAPWLFVENTTAQEDIQHISGYLSLPIGCATKAMGVLDLDTRWRDCYLSAKRDSTQSRVALPSFIGPRVVVTTCQCGGARELYEAAVELGICPTISSLVERAIRHVEEGART